MALLAAAPLAGYLAMPALAGLLIVTAWVMSEPHRWPERLRASGGDRFVLFLTFGLTVLSSLTVAIAIGTAVGLAQRRLRHMKLFGGARDVAKIHRGHKVAKLLEVQGACLLDSTGKIIAEKAAEK